MSSRGVGASRLRLREGTWATVLDALCDQFLHIPRAQWLDRIGRHRVLDCNGYPITSQTPYRRHAEIRYFREVIDEPEIDAHEVIVHIDAHLIVVDKPHFLPMMPAGRFAAETLLGRLTRRFDRDDLVPLHRLDRDTAGLALFSCNPNSRAAYHALFCDRRISKTYEAIAAPLSALAFPRVMESHMTRGELFFACKRLQARRPMPSRRST